MDPGIIGVMIPVVAIFIGGLIAVASIMTKHQRTMAEMVRKNQDEPGLVDEMRAMRSELADLRDRVNQQTLAIEAKGQQTDQARATPPDVPQRLLE